MIIDRLVVKRNGRYINGKFGLDWISRGNIPNNPFRGIMFIKHVILGSLFMSALVYKE